MPYDEKRCEVQGLAWVLYDEARDRTEYAPLDPQDQERITHALQVAGRSFRESADQFPPVIEALKRGDSVPMWAPAPGGVRAAEGLQAEFIRYADGCDALLEKLA